MTVKRHERTTARRAALQVLYTSELTNESAASIAERNGFLTDTDPLPAYAEALVRSVAEHQKTIDEHLISTSENWSLMRMPIVDRSILRLATCEMMYFDDVPTSVAINEAVELAKDFGGEDESPRFVNGVLGRIAKRLEADESGSVTEAPAGADAVAADETAPAVSADVEAAAAATEAPLVDAEPVAAVAVEEAPRGV